MASEKIRFLPNGVDLSWASRRGDGGAFRREHAIPGDARVLLWLARLVDWKRADLALHAFARVRERVPGPLVLVVPAGAMMLLASTAAVAILRSDD